MSIAQIFVGTLLSIVLIGVTNDYAAADADYPARPITLIVPFATGGPTDVVARIIGRHWLQRSTRPALCKPRRSREMRSGGKGWRRRRRTVEPRKSSCLPSPRIFEAVFQLLDAMSGVRLVPLAEAGDAVGGLAATI